MVDNYMTICPSVNISDNVDVGEEAELGTRMQIIQGKTIGRQNIIGAGAAKDMPEKCTAVGSPAETIKF